MRISDWSSDVCSSELVTQLLEDNPFQRTPRWRGLYFGGGGPEAAPGGAFIADLFTRFLPGDQPLAPPRVKGDAGRLTGPALGEAAMRERKSVVWGKEVAVRITPSGPRIIKKKQLPKKPP